MGSASPNIPKQRLDLGTSRVSSYELYSSTFQVCGRRRISTPRKSHRPEERQTLGTDGKGDLGRLSLEADTEVSQLGALGSSRSGVVSIKGQT